jgi:PAS domain S-box-containing protein
MEKLPINLYRDFFYKSNDIIFTLDIDLNFLDANEKAIQTYGFSLDEFCRMNVNDLRDDSEKMELSDLKKNFYSNVGCIFETVHKDKSGNIFPVEISSVRIDIDDTPYIYGLIRVITSRKSDEQKLKLSEIKFRTLAENINDGIMVRAGDELIYANSAFSEIWDICMDELQADPKCYLKQIYPEDLEQLIYQRKIKNFEETGELREEFRIVKKEEHISWIFFRSIPQYVAGEAIPRTIVLATDITERREITANIFSKIIEAEERQKSKLSRELHDGIGPLLAAIRMHLDLLQKKCPDLPDMKKLLKDSMDIADIVIATSRNISHELSSAALNDFGLRIALEGYLEKIKELSGIELNVHVRLLNERFDQGIEKNFFRICQELVNNALKHSGAGRIDINLLQDNRMLMLYYYDNGKGFNTAQQAVLSTTGLGLQNIINRVKTMNGTCEIISEPGKGTRVIISLLMKL